MKKKICLAILLAFATYYFSTTLLYFSLLIEEQRTDLKQDENQNEFSQVFEEAIDFCRLKEHNSSRKDLCSNKTHRKYERNSTMIVGALTFLGARLVSHLASQGLIIQALASFNDILHDRHGLAWYRKEQLQDHHGISVDVKNLTNETQIRRVFHLETQINNLIFVPPGLDGEDSYFSQYSDAWDQMMANALADFVTLLNVVQEVSPCTQVVLISRSKIQHTQANPEEPDSTSKAAFITAWMYSFEVAFSAFRNNYEIDASILRIQGLYGQWGLLALQKFSTSSSKVSNSPEGHCWDAGEVVNSIFQAIKVNEECQLLELGRCEEAVTSSPKAKAGWRKSLNWAKSYAEMRETRSENNIVFTSYFTSTEDSQRNRKKSSNTFLYMEEFYSSLKKTRLKCVIFHDGLDLAFQHRVHSHYPNITFFKVDSLHGRSTNDARFYAYYSFLQTHQDITRVLLTDISDVVFQMDPFQLMFLLGDNLYVGTDVDIYPNMQSMTWIKTRLENCFRNTTSVDLQSVMGLKTVYNAGTIGGTRETVLSALTMIVTYLDTTPPELNCNMPVVNYVVHTHFFDRVFTGFPLNSRFLKWQASPKGVYLIHK